MKRIFFLLLCLLMFNTHSHALVLEELAASKRLETTLENKKIGFYVGSFDPIHKGHEALATDCLEKKLCDLVILFPAWGGDSYKKRADINIRHDMVFALFKGHPTIIVTRLNPRKFQETLTTVTSRTNARGHKMVKPKFKGTQFIGIVGSDTALVLDKSESALKGFMTGIQVPEKYAEHTLGGLMSLPVSSFLVGLREKDDLSVLNGRIGNRTILAVLKNRNHVSYSSTAVKKRIKDRKPIDHMVRSPVISIIKRNKLYEKGSIDE